MAIMVKKMKPNNTNKLQKLEKHRAWAKKHRAERQAEFQARGEDKVKAKKSLGQNFLHDVSVVENICKNIEIEGKVIVEVGPGTGFLTKEILRYNPKKLILIEKDTHLFRGLQKTFDREILDRIVEISNTDALKVELSNLAILNNEKITIIANLPYNVGTTLVMNWLRQLEVVDCIVVMLQKEVVDRIVAKPRTKDYGRISVLAQTLCDCQKLFDVKPECFYPRPKVMSSVVKIIPKKLNKNSVNLDKLDKITRIAFNQRRKKLSNAFKHTEFEKTIIPFAEKRAEELDVSDYIKISNL